jgi:hypothetical protein
MTAPGLCEGPIDPNSTASDVWADGAYRSAENERVLARARKVSRNRRLARGFENLARTAGVLVRLAMIKVMLRRLARA